MKLQVLVSTMHQSDHSLLDKMNIQTDAVVVNQCDRNEIEEFEYKGHHIHWLSLKERGVGLSRNTALMRADADILLFADDDVTYLDGYEDIILREFKEHPQSDVCVFNVPSTCKDPRQKDYDAKKWKRLHLLNSFRHGTFRIAVKREQIFKKNIFFTLLFGGGARYSAGEDSLFLTDCIRAGLRAYESPYKIGNVSHEESTWFKGYTDKYFLDKGAFYACFSKRIPFLWCLQFAIRRKGLYGGEKNFWEACRLMHEGIRQYKASR